ncbi:ROK family protein [Echinimonas agarilytica]|uniref:ROK family protein n=1 Tax=Echinimonas agarilytica TaxID=1215918 RepID=A0AA42B6U4_9GAMM|nr:ROK family protein [Echinimonas agarilytica]MCM2679075.1 ROK family protein [Echinimonas agarilytica]
MPNKQITTSEPIRIGIDLGGTKTECVALDSNTGEQLFRERLPTEKGDYYGTLDTIRHLVSLAETELAETASVGVGIPGTLSGQTGFVKNANSIWLNGRDFKNDLESILGRSIRLANDANCFAVSEAVDGAGMGADVVFGIILGTGVGAGLVVHQSVINGANGLAGEWGHNGLHRPTVEEIELATSCYCGQHGCIETWLSGPSFEREYFKLSGLSLNASSIVHKMLTGDDAAQQCMKSYCSRLVRSLAHMVNMIDPDVIVLGGGMSNVDALYPYLNTHLESHVFGQECKTKVVKNEHGDSSGVRGAAWLWGRT